MIMCELEKLEFELKELVVNTLNLEGTIAGDIKSEEALFVEGLGLDSIDALELGVAIKKKYNISLDIDEGTSKVHFYSIKNLALFIKSVKAVVS